MDDGDVAINLLSFDGIDLFDGVDGDSMSFDSFFGSFDEETKVRNKGLTNGELAGEELGPDGFQENGGLHLLDSSVVGDKLTGEQLQWDASACTGGTDADRENELKLFPEHAESLNELNYNHQPLYMKTDHSNSIGLDGYPFPNSLSSSRDSDQEYYYHSKDSDNFRGSPFGNQHLLKILPDCYYPNDNVAPVGLPYSHNASDNRRETDNDQSKGYAFFQDSIEGSGVNADDMYSIFAQRGGRTDSKGAPGLADGMYYAARTAVDYDSIYEKEEFCLLPFVYSTQHNAVLPNVFVPKNVTEVTHTGHNNGEEIFCRKVEKEGDMVVEQDSCSSSKVDMSIWEHPAVMWSPTDIQMTNFEIPTENLLDDLNFKRESSIESSLPSSRNLASMNLDTSENMVLYSTTSQCSKKQKVLVNNEIENWKSASCHIQHNCNAIITSTMLNNPPGSCISVDDDADIHFLDYISGPLCPLTDQDIASYPVQQSGLHDIYQPKLGGIIRHKEHDERVTLRRVLQDLSQPTSEASPPEGLLSVPLLRHQRIALSWMVQKETSNGDDHVYCSGGILADDQGLGKTITTISLILLERSPIARSCSEMAKQENFEALALDDDEDDKSELIDTKQSCTSNPSVIDGSRKEKPLMVTNKRPAAGTLVVCPTSVLRQWAEELKNKVTTQANLSFLVYHGTNRTKDPNELAKYDVVLTTYSIVSMKGPKQPLSDDDDEKVKRYALGMESLTNKKRKSSGSNRKSSKDGNAQASSLLESSVRPLARVNWFRVILDEAQSIKNHKTNVARSCWGLRAKRRWCLSGTPMQNAVDDLYSYFRFLRYEPYSNYKSFCSLIKAPISKNPVNGYKKLQAVLRTILLRRTKGSLIDGEPIIALPPKTITLKKVEFSIEERTFYSYLEAESREQFKAYAAEGTVQKNYVNILLMLLRLRQACDHPLLVKSDDSNSVWNSSFEMAQKLPKEIQMDLLSRLEPCSTMCVICNDPPKDAVVTTCGHVFCNQCIFQHLAADDDICPTGSCKSRLNVSSIFSKGTLLRSISVLLGDDTHSDDSSSSMLDPSKSLGNSSSHSSKIKAVLEILLSLPKSSVSTDAKDEICTSFENTSEAFSGRCYSNTHDRENSSSNILPNPSVTEKAIVFSQWTKMLDLLENQLKKSGIHYRRLDGTMSIAARDKAVTEFKTIPEVTVIIMSLKAASLGLNMVEACHVVLLDLWWNPTTEDQAIDRAHRIGQTRPVTVSRLTVKDTVEDRILALQEKKREMVASAFGEDASSSRQTRLTVEDLSYLFMV